jgi:glycosyltransferase involved in cell wall biosynthesis
VQHAHLVLAAVAVHPHVIRAVTVPATRALRAAMAALMTRRPKISVITPTWRRRALLLNRCIPSVQAQDYAGQIEHVIVSDGPDPALAGVPGTWFLDEHRPALNRGIWARLAGVRMASGDLIAYLDDDNAWRPWHLRLLAAAIERENADFAWSRAACTDPAGLRWEVGSARPVYGQVDTSLIVHRRDLLATATWEPSCRPADWHLVDRWLKAGVSYAHVPVITLDYYSRTPAVMVLA